MRQPSRSGGGPVSQEYIDSLRKKYAPADCCAGLKGFALAWHRYAAHGGSYPKKARRNRKQS